MIFSFRFRNRQDRDIESQDSAIFILPYILQYTILYSQRNKTQRFLVFFMRNNLKNQNSLRRQKFGCVVFIVYKAICIHHTHENQIKTICSCTYILRSINGRF